MQEVKSLPLLNLLVRDSKYETIIMKVTSLTFVLTVKLTNICHFL